MLEDALRVGQNEHVNIYNIKIAINLIYICITQYKRK